MAEPAHSAPDHPRLSRLEVWQSWHREPSLYREIYARTVSTLLAAGVIYVVGALTGVFSRRPLVYVSISLLIGGAAWSAYTWVQVRRIKKHPGSRVLTPEEAARHAKRFARLLFLNTVFLVLVIVLTVVIDPPF